MNYEIEMTHENSLLKEQVSTVLVKFGSGSTGTNKSLPGVVTRVFLREVREFLSDLSSSHVSTWMVMFSPFAHGILVNGDLYISSRSDDKFMDNVYDRTSAMELEMLNLKVQQDWDKLGSVLKESSGGAM